MSWKCKKKSSGEYYLNRDFWDYLQGFALDIDL